MALIDFSSEEVSDQFLVLTKTILVITVVKDSLSYLALELRRWAKRSQVSRTQGQVTGTGEVRLGAWVIWL